MFRFPWLSVALLIPMVGWLWLILFRTPYFRRIALTTALVSFVLSLCLCVLFFLRGGTVWVDGWFPFFRLDSQNIALFPFVWCLGLSLLVLGPTSSMNRHVLADVLLTVGSTQFLFCTSDVWVFSWAWLITGWPAYSAWLRGVRQGIPMQGGWLFLSSAVTFLVLGVVLFYGHGISFSLASSQAPVLPESIKLVFFVASLWAIVIRMGLFPFHAWVLSSLREGSPVSLLMVLCPAGGIYVLWRLRLLLGPSPWYTVLAVIGVLSAGYFLLVALGQKYQFPSIIYLVLGQMGILLMSLLSQEQQSVTGGLVLWLSVGISGCAILLLSWQLRARRGNMSLDQFHGLARECPVFATLFFLLGMGLIGLPGTLTFVAEDLIIQGILIHHTGLAILYIAVTVLGAIVFLRLFSRIFLGHAQHSERCADLTSSQKWMGLLLALALFLPGFFPYFVVKVPEDFSRKLSTHSSTSPVPPPLRRKHR